MNPFVGGGQVKYTPEKVKSRIGPVPQNEDDQARKLALKRDQEAADLLEADKTLDLLDSLIDDQMKGLALPGGEVARVFCGGDVITWECYKKAKALLQAIPMIMQGFDPVQTVFTNTPIKRVGTKIFDCRQFDPDTFFNYTDPFGNQITGMDAIDNQSTESFEDIQKKALENQKNWAITILFWDVLWGKPEVREPYLSQSREGDSQPKVSGFTVGNMNLSQKLREERPTKVGHLLWEAFPPWDGPLDNVSKRADLNNDSEKKVSITEVKPNAAAFWIDLSSFFNPSGSPLMKNRGIPAIKGGFILPILIGFLGLVPKVMSGLLKIRAQIDKGVNKIPGFLKPIKVIVRTILGLIFGVPAVLNTLFIEICIWLAMLPVVTTPDFADLESITPDKINNPSVLDTPGGWVPPDCFQHAQTIFDTVNQQAISE